MFEEFRIACVDHGDVVNAHRFLRGGAHHQRAHGNAVIVVRLDLATPLRRPDLPQGDRWVFNDQFPRLSDNFIFNIAIGYPF